MVEHWNPIPRAPHLYEASNEGRVRSLDRTIVTGNRWGQMSQRLLRGRVLKPWHDANGYQAVYLCYEDMRQPVNVHRLIAEAFHPSVDGKDHVNHKDGDRANNRPSNLEWCTRTENMAHALETGLIPPARPVTAVTRDGTVTLFFDSAKEAALKMGGKNKRGNIKSALVGLIPSAYGFTWHYA